jgi:hypothetical protein
MKSTSLIRLGGLGFSALSVNLAAPWLRAILVGAPLTLVGYAMYQAGARLDEQLSRVR